MFETHKLNLQGFQEMDKFKTEMSLAVSSAMLKMPEGREKSIFKTKIEEAVFFGAKAIASKQGNFEAIINYSEADEQQGEKRD
jgi:hypothetical protein